VRYQFSNEKLDIVRVAAYLGIPHLSEKGYIPVSLSPGNDVDCKWFDVGHIASP